MELKANDPLVQLERLILTCGTMGEANGSLRQVKGFPVPVKNDHSPREAK